MRESAVCIYRHSLMFFHNSLGTHYLPFTFTRGLPIKGSTSYINEKNQLAAHFSLDIVNAQLATFIPNWNKMNHGLNSSEISEEDYEIWLNDTLKIFNVPIDEYLFHK